MSLSIDLLHRRPDLLKECCDLLNEEWKRSETARMRSFQNSCDSLPTNIILLEDNHLIGHLKLSVIPSIPESCFVEGVVIQKHLRGKGYGTKIMNMAEEYCKKYLNLKEIYLSTKDQERFYKKLGYKECSPISIYGGYPSNLFKDLSPPLNNNLNTMKNCPVPPGGKIYMMKTL
ncbi:N-alpha-acetyltransferase 80 isoform X2 [Coccinella septempunctata]|nr:N-alpha-acetyltransferase 80 isoform X2 [Coccinella septempunctata]XP_044744667.1 N-alpha-acetyltransferase 80 isoform X2 [Coccinella septempunctata]XP_044744668.1 N-alpha-acetyltransferase 80 isoform X2 [Coccinella septempunctata]